MISENFRHMQQQVAEIGGVQRLQPVLIRLVKHLGVAAGKVEIIGGGKARGRQAAVLPPLDQPHQRRRRPALGVDSPGLHHLLQQAELVVGVENIETAGEADERGVAAQHAGAERVERAEPEALGGAPDDGGDALAHFARRLVGEGDGEHLARVRAAGQQDVREPGGQHARLAGAGAGEHQQRPIDGLDGFALFGIEASEVVGHPAGYSGAGESGQRPQPALNGGRTPRICAIA